jgi:MSHA biogenesis protein MshN
MAAAPAKPAPQAAAEPVPARAGKPSPKLDLGLPPARILEAPAQTSGRVQKTDRTRGPDERAEAEFRRGAALLNQGRVSEAEESFAAALAISPAHESARQALVVLYLEHRRVDEARRLLQEGLAANPANVQFGLVLARIHLERRDDTAALDVLNLVRPRAQTLPEFNAILGMALSRLGRHAEAADAYRANLRAVPDNGAAWIGLGNSMEAQGQRAEAAEAFKRAMAVTPPGSGLNNLAEQRLRAVR